jgi:GT2 family glycosyltransferase
MRSRKILIIVSSYNRKVSTIRFLTALHEELNVSCLVSHVVLVDDCSTDGTALAVEAIFPTVQIIHGTGSLYWAGSVRRAMSELGPSLKEFDGIFLANDDIELVSGQLQVLVDLAHDRQALVGGVVNSRSGEVEASGGRSRLFFRPWQKVLGASNSVQECDFLPGHSLYIPLEIYQFLGPFDSFFTHGFLDLEYSIRARRRGINCLIAPGITAFVDEVHDYQRDNRNMRYSLRELWWRIRFHPKSPPIRETIHYLRLLSPVLWPFWVPFYYRGWSVALIRSLIRLKF